MTISCLGNLGKAGEVSGVLKIRAIKTMAKKAQVIKKAVKEVKAVKQAKKIQPKQAPLVKKTKVALKPVAVTTSRKRPELKLVQAAPKARKVTKPKKISVEELILTHRDNGRKLGRSILKRWNIKLHTDEIDSMVDYALCDAAIRYRFDKGASFMTFFYYHLRGHLVRLVADAASTSNMFVSNLTANGSDLTDFPSVSSDAYILPEGAAAKQKSFETPEDYLLKKEELEFCQGQIRKLDTLEQEVVARSYATDEALVDIAKSLGYSRCHVSRVKKRALAKLKRLLAQDQNEELQVIDCDAIDDEPIMNERVSIRKRKYRSRPRRRKLGDSVALEARIRKIA